MVATLFQRTPSTSGLLDPQAPAWAQRFTLQLLKYFAPAFPTTPSQLWVCNKADLPNPADWHGCMVAVKDQSCLVVAQGTQWLKIATSGPV
jgi:hypothetical protein